MGLGWPRSSVAIFLLIVPFLLYAKEEMTYEEAEAQFNTDFEVDYSEVNRGSLNFFSSAPEGEHLRIINHLRIEETSLKDGWVTMNQCHENLEAFPRAEVVYAYEEMRSLRVVETTKIANAKVDGNSVQLSEVRQGAKLCVQADVRIMRKQKGGSYQLINGPFYRRFLDGFYPLYVELVINFPENSLQFKSVKPDRQPGLSVSKQPGKLTLQAWFEGELAFEVYWVPINIHE